MSIQGTVTSSFSFQKGGGLQVAQGNPIESRRNLPVQNLANGAFAPRVPELITPTTGTIETFSARSSLYENDNEVYTFFFPAIADTVDTHLMIANFSYAIDSIKAKFVTASSSGTVDVKICDNGEAISAGTSVLASTMSIAGTADTNVVGSLTTVQADRKLARGQSLAIDFGGTLTSIAGLTVTVVLRRMVAPARNGNYFE
jgi:hypothetical protein